MIESRSELLFRISLQHWLDSFINCLQSGVIPYGFTIFFNIFLRDTVGTGTVSVIQYRYED